MTCGQDFVEKERYFKKKKEKSVGGLWFIFSMAERTGSKEGGEDTKIL